MPPEVIILISLTGLAIVFFAFEFVSPDVTAIGLMLTLILSGILTPQEAFAGFGSDTVLMILGLLIMSSALYQTGVVDYAGQLILELSEKNKSFTVPIITTSVASLSAFISNTAATAFFVPAIIGFARKAKESPSLYLLPLSFASILTSSVTLISTSTNIVISEMLPRYDQQPLGMFELTPIGLPIAIIGLIYISTIGVRLMPKNRGLEEEEFGLKPYLSEIILLEKCNDIGKRLRESDIVKKLGFSVIRIQRKSRYMIARANLMLAEGDILLIEASKEKLLATKDIKGIEIKADATLKLSADQNDEEQLALVEAVIPYRSQLIGKTLKEVDFRNLYETVVLAINRSGTQSNSKMSQTRLNIGDVLLLQGSKPKIQLLNDENIINVIGDVKRVKINQSKAPIAVAAFVLSLTLASMKILSFPVATMLGAFSVFLFGCVTPDESYKELNWKVLILIGSMISLGLAMDKTGTGELLAKQLTTFVGSNHTALLAVFFLFALILTQAMSNQAAAIVLIPIAIPTALSLGINPRSLIVTIAVAASCSFLTPLEPSCLMVYGPGKYKFRDFFIVGMPLTIIIFIMTLFLVPLIWPLTS